METLGTLWAAWWHGPIDPNALLWGTPLWWWNRVGTFVQVFAVIGLVFEIAGFERINATATALRQSSFFNLLDREMSNGASEAAKASATVALSSKVSFSLFACLLYAVMAWGGAWVFGLVWPFSKIAFVENSGFFYAIFVAAVRFLSTILAFAAGGLALFAAAAAAFHALYLLLNPISWLLSSPSLKAALNLMILAATLFNLHFTLLLQ